SVEVEDADPPVLELAALEHLERVALEYRRALGAEPAQVLFQPGPTRRRELDALQLERPELEPVDRDEVSVVAAHRADQARTEIAPDLDVALAGSEQRRGEVEQREDVLLGEVRSAREH